MQDKILDMVMKEDEITWKAMLMDLVKAEGMNPWDIDITLLAQKFLEQVRAFKETDLKVSGKVFLAAAILLRVKSKRLLSEDISNLDRLFAQSEEDEDADGLLDELSEKEDRFAMEREKLRDVDLLPRTPQPRSRKVSIYDLVGALQKAMEVKKRRVFRNIPEVKIDLNENKVDISEIITNVYGRIKVFFGRNANTEKMKFNQLIPDTSKEGKVYTFIPLLHLTNERKVNLHQFQHFGEIEIEMIKTKKEVDKELAASES